MSRRLEKAFLQLRCFFGVLRVASVISLVNVFLSLWLHEYVLKCVVVIMELLNNYITIL
jgi:hypothetical protein